jgi:hypothetical protein
MTREQQNRAQGRRSPTGIGFTIVIRCQPQLLKRIDNWRRSQEHALSRPEAIRRLVEQALPARPAKHGRLDTRAAQKMAGEQIDRILEHSDEPTPIKAQKKKRLTKRPAELT